MSQNLSLSPPLYNWFASDMDGKEVTLEWSNNRLSKANILEGNCPVITDFRSLGWMSLRQHQIEPLSTLHMQLGFPRLRLGLLDVICKLTFKLK